jgi:predicted enzyme related to lactoylglutathione lyase
MSTPICHIEINVKNLVRAKKFYSKVMGWKFQTMMPGYAMFSLGKNMGGALSTGKAGTSSMLPYFHVRSIDRTLERAKALGAKVVTPKRKIGGDHGFMAHVRDSEGNTIGLWNPK